MKTLCELKRKDINKYFDVLAEEQPRGGYLCRECLRYASEKKRLCAPVSLRKIVQPAAPPEP
jgi:hypothetical protein